jgi:autotransporter-associated beta strand protein
VIGGVTYSYDPLIHPPGDGKYRNGYETISYRNLAKNIVTVGAVNDAVTSGVRDLAKATISSFSSTGPTDDGRIKPDLVANGVGLRSTYDTSDTAYASISGTSMATPNACGSATLLVDQYNRLFGGAMRSSTLKALLIHTADDIGNPGPDYFFGWGLMDVKDAADLLVDHQAYPTKKRLTEDQVSTSITSRTVSFTWDGVSPIRATLCWTDPAGTAVSSHDSRTPTLKNNLNLKLIAPNGAEYSPFVMPFVGTWTVASMSQNATTGINNTDNVEQVLVNAPAQPGDWRAVVSFTGTLTNNLQNYGLIISGSANQNVPLAITSISPASGLTGTTVTADITGTKLSANTAIRLRQAGRADIPGTSVQLLNATTLRCQFNLTGAASGLWNLIATNPDTETYTLPDAFTITGSLTTLWSENFDGTPAGWTSQATTGSNSWTITTAQSHTPTKSYFAAGPSTASTTYLTSPSISIPSNPTNIQIEFWHNYDLQAGRDGGRFALSIDGGAWFDVTDANSGAAFANNGYNTAMAANGQTGEFAGLQAWSGVSGGFIRTAVNLNDIPKFAGKNLRMRWGLATNNQSASNGWHVDSVAIISDSSAPNQAPAIITAATTNTAEFQTDGSTTWHVLRGTNTNLSVTAGDDAGEPDLTYTWQSSGPAPVTFSLSGNNAAKSTTATFSAVGDYVITVNALDTGGLSTPSSVNVRVLETSIFDVAPNTAILNIGQTQQFTAALVNQFGTPNASQPSPITWSTNGGGSISSSGLFTAASVGGPYTITASSGVYSAMAEAVVNPAQAGIQLDSASLNQTYDNTPRVVTATTSPPGLSYSISYNGQSTAPTNAGNYNIAATITDPNYQGSDSGTLVVAKASQTINFAALDPVYDNAAPFALSATASSGLTISYTSSNTAVATVSGNTVTIVGAGSTTITASQSGNTNYNAATSVPQTLNVVRFNPLAVTGGPYSVIAGQSVTLNGSASQPSYNETINSYEWDLNNDNVFGDATGASPVISYSALTTTWSRLPGPNTIQLRVTDSAGKTSTASTTLTLIASLTWDANTSTGGLQDGGGAWLTANQWWTGSAYATWSSSANAIFGNGGTGGAVTVASPTTVNNITFNTFTGTYTLGSAGQTITLNGGINNNSAAGVVSIISPLALGGGQTWSNNSSGTLTASGAISGSGGITKTGAGRLLLSGVNSYSGKTLVSGGTLRFGTAWNGNTWSAGGSLPSTSNLEINGGIVEAWYARTFSGLGTAAGEIQLTGGRSGFTNLQGDASATWLTIGATGTLITWGAPAFSPTTLVLNDTGASCVLRVANPFDLSGASRTVEVSASGTGGGRGTYGVFERALSGIGASLVKTGSGTLMLDGANTYDGGTAINAGGVWFNRKTAMPSSGAVTVSDGTILSVTVDASNGWTTGTGGNGTIGGLLAGLGGQAGGTVSYSGNVNVGFNVTGTQSYAGNINNVGTTLGIHMGNKDSGTASDPFAAAGTLTLSGNNGYTGITYINRGILVAGSANALGNGGDITFRGGTLQYTASSAGNNYGSRIKNSTSVITLDSNSQNVALSGIANSNTGGLTKSGAGTLTFSGTNSYTGATTVSGGSITLNNGTVNSQSVTLNASNTTMSVLGGGVNSTWNLGNQDLSATGTPTANIQLVINGGGTAGSAVVTNVANLVWGRTTNSSGILLTNGGQMNVNAEVRIGNPYYSTTGGNTLTIQGGTATSTFTGNPASTFYIGYGERPGATNNVVTVSSGGVLTSIGHVILGQINNTQNGDILTSGNKLTVTGTGSASVGAISAGYIQIDAPTGENRRSNSNILEVTNGGTLTSSGAVIIGRANNVRSNTIGNTATVSGTGSSWNASNQNITVGLTNNASAVSNNNILTVGAGASLTNVNTLTVGSGSGTETGNQLVVNGSLSATSVTVNAANSLSGTGTITGAVTVNGTVAPGTSVGTLNVTGNTSIAGTLQIEVDGGSADILAINGNVNISNATLSIVPTGAGATQSSYTFLTYTGTLTPSGGPFLAEGTLPVGYSIDYSTPGQIKLVSASGPGPLDHFTITPNPIGTTQTVGTPIAGITITAKDASEQTVTSFTGTVNFSGTGGFSGTSASFTLGELSSVTGVIPTNAGSNLTLVVTDGVSGKTGSTAITIIQTQYQSWAGGAAFGADSNGDGVNNGLAWLLGAADPNASALDKLPVASRNGGNLRLTFRCLNSSKRGGAALKVQFSNDLGTSDPWTSHEAAVPDTDSTVNGVIFDTTDDGDFVNVIADIPAAGANLFGRLKAEQP